MGRKEIVVVVINCQVVKRFPAGPGISIVVVDLSVAARQSPREGRLDQAKACDSRGSNSLLTFSALQCGLSEPYPSDFLIIRTIGEPGMNSISLGSERGCQCRRFQLVTVETHSVAARPVGTAGTRGCR